MVRPFQIPDLAKSWYIGHMRQGERLIRDLIKMQQLDFILEARDARLPLTSRNPLFQDLTRGNEFVEEKLVNRAVVFLKRDLADQRLEDFLLSSFHAHDPETSYTFATAWRKQDLKSIVSNIVQGCEHAIHTKGEAKVLIAGMPNVGKSSLINHLRSMYKNDTAKVAPTAPHPGLTRSLSSTIIISLDPKVYVYDSPGIMVPYLGPGDRGSEKALKLACVRGINEDLVPIDVSSAYLLWRIARQIELGHLHPSNLYETFQLPQTISGDDPIEFFLALAMRLNAKDPHGEWDLDRARYYFMRKFWDGSIGRITLDALGRGDEVVDQELSSLDTAVQRDFTSQVPLSRTQMRAKEKVISRNKSRLHISDSKLLLPIHKASPEIHLKTKVAPKIQSPRKSAKVSKGPAVSNKVLRIAKKGRK